MTSAPHRDSEIALIDVAVVYVASPWRSFLYGLRVPAGTTAAQAVRRSALVNDCPEAVSANMMLGIFACRCPADRVLQQGDRVEVYRPLHETPQRRRQKKRMWGWKAPRGK